MALSLLSMALFLCVCVLRKGKRKPASQDRNGYLRRGLWVQALHHYRENRAQDPSGCIAATLHPQFKNGLCKLDMTNGWGEPPNVPRDAGLLFNIPQSPLHCQRGNSLLQNPGSFLKQDVCLRPPSPQINNPQNLILGGRVEALESHYFHIPYPGALGLLRECGRQGAGKAQGCGGNLRPCARLQGEMSLGCITLGSVGWSRGIMPQGGEGDIANMLMQLTLHQTVPLSEQCRVSAAATSRQLDVWTAEKKYCIHSTQYIIQ